MSDTGVSTGIHTNWFPDLSSITKPSFTLVTSGAVPISGHFAVPTFTGLYPSGIVGLFALGVSPSIVLVFSK